MENLKNRLKNPVARKLIIKMAELAQAWQEPYDSMDKCTQDYNLPLEQKWDFYVELLEELVE
jgi:hypothetical protein